VKIHLLPATETMLAALCADLIAGKMQVVWCTGPGVESLVARLAATEKLDNATDAAGMVLDEDGYPCEHYPWIHIIDKTQIVTSVEDGRTKQGRGSW
jgi:hypothetical protein